MKLLILLIAAIIASVSSQSATCRYYNSAAYGYTCAMTITNPNGFDNLTQIDGAHLAGKTNADVRRVEKATGANSVNFPTLICQTFRNTDTITFSSVGIKVITENSFKHCEKLQNLYLWLNKISDIAENAFANNLGLRELDLGSNLLKTLPRNLLRNVTLLETLYLYTNQLEELADDTFSSLVNLKGLFMYSNKLSSMSSNIFSALVNVEKISLDNNRFTVLNPSWFANMAKLEYLYFHLNQIVDLPQNIFSSLVNLKVLHIYNDNLTVIHSDSFSLHPNFVEFAFSGNNLHAFDERLIDNTALTTIRPGYNPCVLTNDIVNDYTQERTLIRAALERCFENYEPREEESAPFPCGVGTLDERVCALEITSKGVRSNLDGIGVQIGVIDGKVLQLSQANEKLEADNKEIKSQISALTADNEALKSKNRDIEAQIAYILEQLEGAGLQPHTVSR